MTYRDLDNSVNHRIATSGGLLKRLIYRLISENNVEITPEQWTVLSFLWKEDGITQQKLCDATFKDKPSMTRLIDNLVKQDLVYRDTAPNDRRSNLIFLTKQGKSIKDKANAAVTDTARSALAGIDENGLEQVRATLKLVFSNIQESLKEP